MKFEFKIGEIKQLKSVTIDGVESEEKRETTYLKNFEVTGTIDEQELRETNVAAYLNKVENLMDKIAEIKEAK